MRRLFHRMRQWRAPVRIVPALAALLALAGVLLAGNGLVMQGKAALAQFLLERAFAKSLHTEEPVRPWPWADTWPVARLEAPRLGVAAIVLDGGSGEALAFGPGHLEGTPPPGEPGVSVIAAHRDTHFRFLGALRAGDEIRVTRRDGVTAAFRVVSTAVVRRDASGVDPHQEGSWLVLATCWPLDAVTRGDLRYIVRAQRIGGPPPGPPPAAVVSR